MAKKVKVRVIKDKSHEKKNKVNTADVQLAHHIIEHVRDVLPKQFDYILKHSPDVRFWFDDNRCMLESITFETEGEDSIFIDEESVCLYLSDVDKHDTLFQNEGFFDIFRMRSNNIYQLEPDVQEALTERRTYHMETF